MSTTKLDLVNRVLDSVGERRLTSIGTDSRALIVEDCIQTAIDDLAFANNWVELKKFETPDSWSDDVATIDSTYNVSNVAGVYWNTSPDGDEETTYNYSRYPVRFVTNEDFVKLQQWNYDTDAQLRPLFWTYVTENSIKLSPYPTDETEQGKILVEYYYIPTVPSGDSDTYAPSDQWMRLVELKASALFALRFVSDTQLHQVYTFEYNQLKTRMGRKSNGLPSGGYTMYAGTRSRNVSRW